jgi:hypothetical protein
MNAIPEWEVIRIVGVAEGHTRWTGQKYRQRERSNLIVYRN